MEDAVISGLSDKTYTGDAITQTLAVTHSGNLLEEGTDYTVAYSNNINAGTATVTITGKGEYTGKIEKTFTIAKADQNITVKAAAAAIDVGKTTKVTASGARETVKYTFTSSNTKVAAVNAKGTVTGKAACTVTITVKTPATANYNAGSGTVEITVSKVLKKPGNCRFVKWNNSRHTSCRIAWNKVVGAEGYQILVSWTDGSHENSAYVDSNVLYEDCTVSGNRVSQVKVRAYYMLDGERKFGPWSNTVRINPSHTKHNKKNGGGFFARIRDMMWYFFY